jgi:polysaccharide export outer membrane protein
LPVITLVACAVLSAGCVTPPALRLMQLEESSIPRELEMATLPAYVVEPKDILLIQAVTTLRSASSPLMPGDRLQIQLKNGLPIDVGVDPELNPLQFNAELQVELGFKLLAGTYLVGSDGLVDLGPAYGRVAVVNMTVAEAEVAIRQHLEQEIRLKAPQIRVTLADIEFPQPVAGEHLVRPDGRVSLGIYGEVLVAGMTLAEVQEAVQRQLAARGVEHPRVAVDVLAYNSKQIYVITDGGGFGEQVVRIPYTGNDTVLDAIAQMQGLSQISSKRIWVARPVPATAGAAQILEVEWEDIVALGQTATNYQLLPGDRIYIKADTLIATDNFLAKAIAPVERVLGVTLLGFGVVRGSKNFNIQGGVGGGGFGF